MCGMSKSKNTFSGINSVFENMVMVTALQEGKKNVRIP